MGDRVRGRGRPPRTRANRPEVIMERSLIVGHHQAGEGIKEICRQLGFSRNKVRRWLRRHQNEGHVLTRQRPGRPRVTTPEEDDTVLREAERNSLTTAVSLTRQAELRCSVSTTRRRLRENGLCCYVPASKEILTEESMQCRLRFAQLYINKDLEFWRSVIFTDEKCFSSVSAFGLQCWQVRNTKFTRRNIHERTRSGRVSLSFHGWMWWGGPGELVTIEGNLDSEQYINILETSLIPSARAYAIPEPLPIHLVQDRSPIHTSRAVRRWFDNHPEIILLDWPSKGCDCNPIENLWAFMVQELGDGGEDTRGSGKEDSRSVGGHTTQSKPLQ